MRYIKSNSGLGHREYVYLMPLKKEGPYKHLVSNTIGMYVAGHIVDIEPYESEGMVSREEALDLATLSRDVILYFEKRES